MNLQAALREHFGFESFRPGQEETTRRVLAGENLLVVMPTGSGKSLCYQLPASLLEGVTLVVSPLIALMKDQVDTLVERQKVAATYINSSLTPGQQSERLKGIREGRFRLVYIAPERFRVKAFTQILNDIDVSLLVVDEAHCISEWGHDFRPDYLHIRDVLPRIGQPHVLALTATATPKVQEDIVEQLGVSDMDRLVTGFDRANLVLEVHYTPDDGAKFADLTELLREVSGKGILYVGTRRDAEEVAEIASEVTNETVEFYHGGMPPEERTRVQEAFMNDEVRIVTATNAFGMGIDKPDIRFIFHYTMPGSIEAYYQEAGRAGRDGGNARCVLLYSPQDRSLQEYFINNAFPADAELFEVFGALQDEANSAGMAVVESEALEAALGLQNTKLRVTIHELGRIGVIRRHPDVAERLKLEVLAERIPTDALREWRLDMQRRRKDREAKLAAIVRYGESNECRRRILLKYFGDPADVEPSERCCDNCAAVLVPTTEPEADATEESSRVAHVILEAATAFRTGLGRRKLASVLQGSRAKWVAQFQYDRSQYYGALGRFKATELGELIDVLLEQGLLKVIGGEYPVLALTPSGEKCLAEGTPVALPLAATPAEEVVEFGPPDESVLSRLREFRIAKAREVMLPAYTVLHNSTLEEIARRLPASLAELGEIRGIGEQRLAQHGSGILEVVRNAARGSPPAEMPAEKEPAEPTPDAPTGRSGGKRLFGDWAAGYALDFTSKFEGSVRKRTEIGELIYQFKYRERKDLAEPLARRLAGLLGRLPELSRVDHIVPVPSTEERDRFQPVAELCRRLSQVTGIPINLGVLERVDTREPQKNMEAMAQKKANIRGAFRVQNSTRVKGRTVLLIDDFYDSGTTLNECARVLKDAGAADVFALTLGKTIHHA